MNARRIILLLTVVLMIGFLLVPYSNSAAEKKLTIAIGMEPTTVDQSSSYLGSADYQVAQNYAEYLVYRTPSGDLKPGLASWKISPDGNEIEFALRKGIKFHSGDFLTAKDVAFSFDRGRVKSSTTRTRLASMEKFEVIDDYHFKIHFKTPDVTFIPNLGGPMIVSKSYYDRVGEDKFVKQPIGTGPYKLVRYVPGEYVDMERFEDYWGEKPSVKEVRFLFVPEDTTRLAKLKAGEVDFIAACPYPSVKDVQTNPGLKVIKFPTGHPSVSVVFSPQNPKVPWHDRRVRLAMAYAINCDTIIKNILQGIPDRYVFLAPYELGYDPELKHYPYDPKKARDLLAESGYPNGFDLKLYWPITGRVPMLREVTEAVASYFEAIGIRTKLMGEEFAASLARVRTSKGPDAEYVSIQNAGRAGSPDPSYYLNLFYGKEGGFSVYYNPEFEKVAAEAKATINDTKRAEVIKKAVRILLEDVPSIPIFNNVAVYAMKKNIDFKPTQKYNMDLVLVKDITTK
jgi:peptide/nickel transport system substrate-binding protein